MKNLKKVLALVLVVATLFSFATIAGAKFNDDKSIQYNEAVEVMTALGVIAGYSDNTFRPTANVTRAQMAKMIAFVVSSGEDVGDLYASANKFADCANSWAKGYIAYAVNADIIVGFNDGSFRPDGSVTGAQTAKMLLCALGYDAQIQQYAVNWPANVIKDAKSAGLLKGLEKVNMNVAMTREQAAQMIFNALKATMVGYDNTGYEIALPDGTIIRQGASTPKKIENSKNNDYRSSADAKDEYLQLCEEYFDGAKGLKYISGNDDFNRNAGTWKYNGKDINEYASSADLIYNGSVKISDIYKDLGKPTVDTSATTPVGYYVDGAANGALPGTGADNAAKFNSSNDSKVGAANTIVEVYHDTDADTVKIIVVSYIYDTVKTVKAAKGDDEAYITLDVRGSSDKYETTSFAKDDKVIYTYAAGKIQSVQLVTSIEGKVTAVKGTDITIGGTKYTNFTGSTIAVKDEGTFYLGINDEIVAVDTTANSDDFLYIYKVVKNTNAGEDGLSDSTYTAYTVNDEGKKASYVIKSGAKDAANAPLENTNYTGVIAYSINKDGELTVASSDNSVTVKASLSIEKDKAAIGGKYADAATEYVFVSTADNKLTISTATGYKNVGTQTKDGYVVYDGSKAVTVFVVGKDSGSAKTEDYYYLQSTTATETLDDNDDTIYTYSVVFNGNEMDLKVDAKSTMTGLAAGDVFTVSISDGIVTETSKVTANGSGTVALVTDDYIVVGSVAYNYADKYETYLREVDGSNYTFATDTAAKDDTVDFYLDDGKIVAIVITAEG